MKTPPVRFTMNETAENQRLQEVLRGGVAFHHAGLCPEDRTLVETLFMQGYIQVLCTTSTLAHGVNLPARLVVIKGSLF
jgi:replicative superfamily II helicase